jgi:hypothetical protein
LESFATQEAKFKLIDSLALSGLFNVKNKEIDKIHFQDKEIFKNMIIISTPKNLTRNSCLYVKKILYDL